MQTIQPSDTLKADEVIIPIKKRIFVHISGGADSSLILYLTAKKLQEQSMQSIPIDCFGLYKMEPMKRGINNIIDYVARKFPNLQFNKILRTLKPNSVASVGTQLWEHKLKIIDNFYKKELNLEQDDISFLLGVTKVYEGLDPDYPAPDIANRQGQDWIGMSYLPFGRVTKDAVSEIYDELNLEDLFKLTHSCSWRDFGDGHCGECHWCKERKSAFGKLQ
tara:strand:+ start:929 stop:1588 length:660 start_codon:yes stop_codon:yes gene_type:complete